MSIEAATPLLDLPDAATDRAGGVIHPRWVRITHWINALAMFMMIGSGWQIYDASPLFRFSISAVGLALGDWLAGALLWHFAAMWLLVVNGIVYVTLGIRDRPLPPQTLADPAARGCCAISPLPCAAGSPMTIFRSTMRCSGCSISA